MPVPASVRPPVNSVNGLATQFMVTHILSFTPYTIVYYDYFLTLSDEVELFWMHPDKFNLFSLFFFLNRYVPLFGDFHILISGIIGPIDMSCKASHVYSMSLLLIQQTLVAILCVVQIHAIYQSRRILALLISVSVIGFVVPCWSIYAVSSQHLSYPRVVTPILGCTRPVGETEGFYSAIAWTGCLIVDTIVFALLLYKRYSMGRGVRLLDTIIRNAALYYSILSLVNLCNILILRFASPSFRTSTIALTNMLSSTLISRVIFDLRSKFRNTGRTQPTVTTYGSADERTERGGVPSFVRHSFSVNPVPSSIVQTR